jgi:glycosyltransferase involved in cell wall biosynthesis
VISYIIAAYHHPVRLTCCLASLALQNPAGELIVADNSTDPRLREANGEVCQRFGAVRSPHVFATGCYDAAEPAVRLAHGDWLCFPSDDGYYVPGFSAVMLGAAGKHGWDFVYCDCLYDPRHGGAYSVLEAHPSLGRIDKTNFILRRNWWRGFPPHEASWRDGALAASLVERGIRHGKAPGILVVHN